LSRRYTTRDNRVAALHLGLTLAVFFAALLTGIRFADTLAIALPMVVLVALSGVRLFMLQHDCGHGSFFTSRRLNDVVGTALAPLTLTPFAVARHNHNLHHAHIGNLDERDSSEIYTMTLAEFEAAPLGRQLAYRLYRSPLTLLIVGPTLIYLLRYRWPRNTRQVGAAGVLLHDLLIAVFVGGLVWTFGWAALWIWLGAVPIAATLGGLITYVQHNFEHVYWQRKAALSFPEAAMEGSAVLDFGPVFDLVTANIAYHDLHHLNASIPSYRLKRCHRDLSALYAPTRIGWRAALACFRWKLWDERAGRMVPFPPLLPRSRAARPA